MHLLKMANNNVSSTSTTSTTPTISFVPRIVMMPTYTQYTQTPLTLATSTSIQTNRQMLNTTSTQTKTFQTPQVTQTSPNLNSHPVQKEHLLNETFPLDSSASSTSTDVLDEVVVSNNQPNLNRKRKTHKDHISHRLSTKQRKKVTFSQNQ